MYCRSAAQLTRQFVDQLVQIPKTAPDSVQDPMEELYSGAADGLSAMDMENVVSCTCQVSQGRTCIGDCVDLTSTALAKSRW